MKTPVTRPGIYGNSLPSGEWVNLGNDSIDSHLGPISLPGEDVLHLVITKVGGFKIAGQGHQTGAAWLWEQSTSQWRECGPTFGIYSCIFDANGNLVVSTQAQGGQGYRYVDDNGNLVTGDDSLNQDRRVAVENGIKAIWEFTVLGGVSIGQGESGCHVLIDNTRRMLVDGPTHFIQVHRQGDKYSIALTMLGKGTVVFFEATKDELRALPLVSTTPPVVIPPKPIDPPKEPTKPMPTLQLTGRQQEIVQQLRDKYSEWADAKGENQDDERRKLAKVIAEQFRFEFGETWGWKSNHGNTENDAPSKDAIAHRPGAFVQGRQDLDIFDLFNGTTRQPNNPCFAESEYRSQYFIPVQPINHLEVKQPDPVDPPKDPDPKPDTGDIEALAKSLAEFESTVNAALATLTTRVTNLENKKPPTPGTPVPTTFPTAKDIAEQILTALKGKILLA